MSLLLSEKVLLSALQYWLLPWTLFYKKCLFPGNSHSLRAFMDLQNPGVSTERIGLPEAEMTPRKQLAWIA